MIVTPVYDRRSQLYKLLIQTCIDARLDDVSPDGICWCSDSNGAIDVPELVDKIMEIVAIAPKSDKGG
jgi:hypothetical protein